MSKINLFLFMMMLALFSACTRSTSEDNVIPVEDATIEAEDLIVTIDENPDPNSVLWKITYKTAFKEGLTFSLFDQSVEGALVIDSKTGEIRIANPLSFDYDRYPEITAKFKIKTDRGEKIGNITIKLSNIVEAFIFKVKISGTSETLMIYPTIPSPEAYNYTVDWGDGSPAQTFKSANNINHLYIGPKTFTVKITGKYPGLKFNDKLINTNNQIIDVVQWGENEWETMEHMFLKCNALVSFSAKDIPNISRTADKVSLAWMFRNASNFNGNINHWDVSNVKDMTLMFQGAQAFNQPLNDWDVSSVTDMKNMFQGAQAFNQPLNDWDVSSVTDMSYMFNNAQAFNQPLNSWDVSSVTDMSYMFNNAITFNQDLKDWNTENVKTMNYMFSYAKAFNSKLSNWNTKNVETMEQMFDHAEAFNQTLNSWNVSNVKTMESMFGFASNFNGDISAWNVGNVTNMQNMFREARSFAQDLSEWRPKQVTTFFSMFQNASKFDSDLSDWLVKNETSATNIGSMFYGATSFQGKGLEGWDVSNVTIFSSAFNSAINFNANIEEWQVGNGQYFSNMFKDTEKFNADISIWDMRKAKLIIGMFNNARAFDKYVDSWSLDAIDLSNPEFYRGFVSGINYPCDKIPAKIAGKSNLGCI